MPNKKGVAPVAFDEQAWQEDLRRTSEAGRSAAVKKRAEAQRDGPAIDELLPCEAEARDGTSLPGCFKIRVPHPDGPWGIVYLIALDPQSSPTSLDSSASARAIIPRSRTR